MRIVQLQRGSERFVARVDEPQLRLLRQHKSAYALAQQAINGHTALKSIIDSLVSDETLEYDAIYDGQSPWKLLLPIDHPIDPARCLVTGTGLTHLGSARDRQSMHEQTADEKNLTDSMRMFRWGVERGKPAPGQIGIAPEWFFKGNGTILRGPGEALEVPAYAEDGGEEGEIAGVYLIGPDRKPYRIGMTIGNEFSDHRFEKRNYLNLAGSKLRTCSIGPELVIDPDFSSVSGQVSIERGGKSIWSKSIKTGEAEMCHSLANIEHHHFKFEGHRRPGDLHVHYFGAHSLSFGDGVELKDGDMMEIAFENFGRPLRNPLKRTDEGPTLITTTAL